MRLSLGRQPASVTAPQLVLSTVPLVLEDSAWGCPESLQFALQDCQTWVKFRDVCIHANPFDMTVAGGVGRGEH